MPDSIEEEIAAVENPGPATRSETITGEYVEVMAEPPEDGSDPD